MNIEENLTYENHTEEDWSKLSGNDWANLLREYPQFANKCDWKKLNWYDWDYLLKRQPQLKKYKL